MAIDQAGLLARRLPQPAPSRVHQWRLQARQALQQRGLHRDGPAAVPDFPFHPSRGTCSKARGYLSRGGAAIGGGSVVGF